MKRFGRWLIAAAIAGLVLGAALLGYGHFIEIEQLTIHRMSPQTPRLAKALSGKRLVIVSDLHMGKRILPRNERLAKKISELAPDYILIIGDMMAYRGTPDAAIAWMKTLPPTSGTYAVLGDSDTMGGARNCAYCHEQGSTKLHPAFSLPPDQVVDSTTPVRMLNQRFEMLAGTESPVVIAGTSPEWIEPDLSFLDDAPKDAPVILLSHYPETLTEAQHRRVDLLIAADTHGGQIWAPEFVYRLVFRPSRAKYRHGLFQEDPTSMLVTSGFGNALMPVRIGVVPEVVVVDF